MLYQLSYTRVLCPSCACVRSRHGGGRIRTYVGQSPADLQSATISRSVTPPLILARTAGLPLSRHPSPLHGILREAPVMQDPASARGRGLKVGVASGCAEADEGNRTPNLLITNQLLCQLSYVSTKPR